jgi:hypothetical protein
MKFELFSRRPTSPIKRIATVSIFVIAIVAIVWYRTREARNQHDKKAAAQIVSEFGGSIGSIQPPFSPDSEYYVTFPDMPYTRNELQRLAAFNALAERNPIMICFYGDLAPDDIAYLKQLLPRVGLKVKDQSIQGYK